MLVVVDASVALTASLSERGFDALANRELSSPPLMWSEARAALRQLWWRGQIGPDEAEVTRQRLESCPVDRVTPDELADEAWKVSVELGWAKTYDAEYVALARILGCRVVTLDARLRRGADRLGLVVLPEEL
ncbi:MAG: type II toxin-antitoxin system VapC family toxin [Thermoleophilaceae bacterium]|nr:type II toxin-antitoxin system VapC family toxin [Thermoleophilaceae bacterium]